MKTKRILSLLLITVILVISAGIFAVTALATEPGSEPEITYVSTWAELMNAVNSDKTYIKLATSITDDVPDDELPTKHRLLFDGGEEYVLDLGPYMLYVRNTCNEFYTDNFSMIGVSNNSKLTVKGGNIRFENYYADSRASKGVINVADTSTLVINGATVKNHQTGPVIYAEGDASVTINGGDYTVQNGFALHFTERASLKLDDGVYVHTSVGDSAETTFTKGYGALYSESTGTLDIQSATFKSGVQVHPSQIGAFDISTHEVVINGEQITEDIFVGSFHEAKAASKEYYWYDFHMMALNKVGEYSVFSNTVRVISYDKKSPITVENGTATVGGVPVTEATYGQTVTIVADAPEAGKEFVSWAVSGGAVDYPFNATSTLTMAPNAMTITACYGNAAITSTDITITPPEAGKTPSMTASASNHAEAVSLEWYIVGHGATLPENEIFYPGFDYGVRILLYPEADYKFADTVAVTVNGENATVSSSNAGYVVLSYEFDALPANPFNVSYKPGYQNGVDGQIELNIDAMKDASAAFSEALDADKVSYRWYRDGVAIDGAEDTSYTFVNDDVDHNIYCVVTANETVAYGYTVMCTKELYKVYFNLSEILSGGRAPELTSATPGIAISASSFVICEKYSEIEFGSILDISQMVLIPGKTYRIVANYVITEPDISVGSNASFFVNGNEAVKDGWRIIYDFTMPAADFDLAVTSEDTIGIGAELVADEIAGATYQWYRNGAPINGATARSYIVTPADKNSLIHCSATKGDGSCGYSSQVAIAHYITVIRLSGPTPKNGMLVGDAKSTKFSVDAATVSLAWFIGTADNIINHNSDNSEFLDDNSYAFVEGTNYVIYAIFTAKDTYEIHPNAAARYNGINGEKFNSATFLFDVVAIHAHEYGDTYNAYDEDGHWKRCIVPGCTAPDEEWEETYMPHWSHTATCVTKGKCGECDFEYYGAHDIAVSNYVYIDDMKCGSFCATEGCDYLSEWSYHTGGTSDCQHKSVCEICHEEYGALGEHIPEAEWVSDGTYHWHECKNCDGQQLDKVACSGGTATCTAKAICSVCNTAYGDTAEHDYATENGYKGADGHANTCSCGAHDTPTAHVPDKLAPTETEPITCTVCGYIIESATGHISHTPKAEWATDGTYHWHECTGCEGQQLEKAAHSGGTATCTAKAICSVCNTAYGDTAEHDYVAVNGYKGTDGHANTCSCGAHDTPTAHVPDKLAPTETDPITCTVCGYIIEPATGHIAHTPKDTWVTDGTYHWHECTGCEGQQLEKAAHSGGTATCTAKAICSVCNTAYGSMLEHSHSAEWQKNADEHWNECACGSKANIAAHTDTDNDGKCDICNYTKPGTDPEPPATNPPANDPSDNADGLGAGAIVGIVIGSVAVAGTGGFSLLWFVIKKKSWADLVAVFKK